jgi:hypothetical protein
LAPRSPFFAQDYSRNNLNTAQRARKFAKPDWGPEGRDHEQFMALLAEEKLLNETIDFTFEHKWEGTGNWNDSKQYEIAVPDKYTISDKDMIPTSTPPEEATIHFDRLNRKLLP